MRRIPIVWLLVATSWWLAANAWATSEAEPNETVAQATEVPAPESAEGFRSATSDVDTFRFTGLLPGVPYEAFADAPFLGLAWIESDGDVIDSTAFQGQGLSLEVVPDGGGDVWMAICGYSNLTFQLDCSASSSGLGAYVLTLPEPAAGASALAALSLVALLRRRTRSRPLR